MRTPNLFLVELKAALGSPRRAAVRAGATLLLGFPFALLDLPPRVRSSGLGMVVVFAGVFGAVVAEVRRRSEGRAERLRLLPIPRWLVAADTCLAGALVDLAQVLPLLLLYLAVAGGTPGLGAAAGVAGLAAGALVALNALGLALGRALRSNAEAHLFGALAAGGVALVSGLLPVPPRLAGWAEAGASWSPLAHLARALEGVAAGGPAGGAAGLALLGLAGALWTARALDLPPPRAR